MKLQLLLTPFPLGRIDLSDKSVVVIDVLRASTSVCAALSAGARGIVPVAEPGEAGELRAKLGPEQTLLAGEREGVKIENFQLGNSPAEFADDIVRGKTIIHCTTNGTGVLSLASQAGRVFCGALVNVSRLAETLETEETDLVVVCAGREGGFSIEDTLCGGLLIEKLEKRIDTSLELNDAARLARLLYSESAGSLRQAIAQGEHGRFLASIGMGCDVALCSEVDSMPVLAEMRDGRLVANDPDN